MTDRAELNGRQIAIVESLEASLGEESPGVVFVDGAEIELRADNFPFPGASVVNGSRSLANELVQALDGAGHEQHQLEDVVFVVDEAFYSKAFERRPGAVQGAGRVLVTGTGLRLGAAIAELLAREAPSIVLADARAHDRAMQRALEAEAMRPCCLAHCRCRAAQAAPGVLTMPVRRDSETGR